MNPISLHSSETYRRPSSPEPLPRDCSLDTDEEDVRAAGSAAPWPRDYSLQTNGQALGGSAAAAVRPFAHLQDEGSPNIFPERNNTGRFSRPGPATAASRHRSRFNVEETATTDFNGDCVGSRFQTGRLYPEDRCSYSIHLLLASQSISSAIMLGITSYRNKRGLFNKVIGQVGYGLTAMVAVVETVAFAAITALSCLSISPKRFKLVKPDSAFVQQLASSLFVIGWAVGDFVLNPFYSKLVADEKSVRTMLKNGNLTKFPIEAILDFNPLRYIQQSEEW